MVEVVVPLAGGSLEGEVRGEVACDGDCKDERGGDPKGPP